MKKGHQVPLSCIFLIMKINCNKFILRLLHCIYFEYWCLNTTWCLALLCNVNNFLYYSIISIDNLKTRKVIRAHRVDYFPFSHMKSTAWHMNGKCIPYIKMKLQKPPLVNCYTFLMIQMQLSHILIKKFWNVLFWKGQLNVLATKSFYLQYDSFQIFNETNLFDNERSYFIQGHFKGQLVAFSKT